MAYYSPDEFSPDTSVGYLTKRIYQTSLLGLEPVFAAEDVTHLQWSALVSLWFDRGGTCAALARDLGHDAGATTRLIDGLEARGFITRSRDSDDRRVINLHLTDAGREVGQRVRMKVTERWNDWLAGWADDDVTRLIGYLHRLRADVESGVVAETGA